MADIVNLDLFVCWCRTWIRLGITRIYDEQHLVTEMWVCAMKSADISRRDFREVDLSR